MESDLLNEALRNLTDKKHEIILLYYFMDMNDTEIADLLKLNRSTVYRHRTSGFIAKRSLRPMKDEYGNQYMVVDETLRRRMETRLIAKILSFEIGEE